MGQLFRAHNGLAGVVIPVVLFYLGPGSPTPEHARPIAEGFGWSHCGERALCTTGARAVAPVGVGALYVWADGHAPVLVGAAGIAALSALAMIGAQVAARTLARRTGDAPRRPSRRSELPTHPPPGLRRPGVVAAGWP